MTDEEIRKRLAEYYDMDIKDVSDAFVSDYKRGMSMPIPTDFLEKIGIGSRVKK